jgi:hypothetical protein
VKKQKKHLNDESEPEQESHELVLLAEDDNDDRALNSVLYLDEDVSCGYRGRCRRIWSGVRSGP